MQTTNRAAVLARADVEITDYGISVRHLDRLLGGLLLSTSPRLDWATLLRRTYAVDLRSARAQSLDYRKPFAFPIPPRT